VPESPRADFQQLQSSLRNALATFGPTSSQYLYIKYMCDELETKLALDKFSISTSEVNGEVDEKMKDA
jgi:hypothetical protein